MNVYLSSNGIELWHVAGWTMVHFLWLGALVAGAAAVCRFFLRRTSPNIRYAFMLVWLIALAALPIGTAAWIYKNSSFLMGGLWRAESSQAGRGIVAVVAPAAADNIIELSNAEVAVRQPTAPGSAGGHAANPVQLPPAENSTQNQGLTEPVPSPTFTATFNLLESCIPYLPWLWLIGTPITFALLLTGIVGTRRLGRASRTITDGPIAELLAQLISSLRIGRRVTIAVCDRIAAPVLIGILRPIILLPPAALTGWSPDEIEMVLLHELAHVRRWDNVMNLLQRLVESLLFFHPAVWLVSSWVRSDREACCDAVVVTRTNRPHAYAEMLVALAAQMPRSVLFHPAASSAMAAGPLRSRIRRILQLEEDPMLVSGKSLALMLGALLIAATLGVLYVPTIGQAEESATEATESTEKKQEESEAKSIEEPTPEPVLIPFNFVLKRDKSGRTRLYMNDQPVADDVVRDTFARQAKFISKLQVSVSAEEGVDHAEVTRVVDLLESLGVKKLALKTDAETTPAAKQPSKFPSLEDQKLADLVFRQLNLEIEPLKVDDLQRVKALGYEGGVKVASTTAVDGQNILTNDLLVGLHVWPTGSVKDVVEILNRDDLTDLNPLKFYVVRQVGGFGGPGPDSVVTGRLNVHRSGAIGTATAKPAAKPVRTNPTLANAEELQVLRERVTIIEEQYKAFEALAKNQQKGGSLDRVKSAAYELALAEGELALAEGRRDVAIEKFKQARTNAEEALSAIEEAYKSGELSYDVLLQAMRNVSEIKLKLIRLQATPAVSTAPAEPQVPADMPPVRGSLEPYEPKSPTPATIETPQNPAPVGVPWSSSATAQQPVLAENSGQFSSTIGLTDTPPSGLPGPTHATTIDVQPDKSNLRYDGKTFYDWRNEWQTELSTKKRLEAVNALAAFGRAGYGKEAAGAILDVAGEYDFKPKSIDNTAEGSIKNAVLNQLAPYAQAQPTAKHWVPSLAARLAKEPRKWQSPAIALLHRLQIDDKDTIAIIRSLAETGPEGVRGAALGALVRSKRLQSGGPRIDDATQALLTAALKSKDPAMIKSALNLLYYQPMPGGVPGTLQLVFQSELVPLLFHSDKNIQQFARNLLASIKDDDVPQAVESLLVILQDDSRKPDRIAAIRALGAIGPKAAAAQPPLEKTFDDVSQDMPLRVAAAFAIDRIEGGQRLRNKLMHLIDRATDEKVQTQMNQLYNAEQQAANE